MLRLEFEERLGTWTRYAAVRCTAHVLDRGKARARWLRLCWRNLHSDLLIANFAIAVVKSAALTFFRSRSSLRDIDGDDLLFGIAALRHGKRIGWFVNRPP
jgi:hypothetical protein